MKSSRRRRFIIAITGMFVVFCGVTCAVADLFDRDDIPHSARLDEQADFDELGHGRTSEGAGSTSPFRLYGGSGTIEDLRVKLTPVMMRDEWSLRFGESGQDLIESPPSEIFWAINEDETSCLTFQSLKGGHRAANARRDASYALDTPAEEWDSYELVVMVTRHGCG